GESVAREEPCELGARSDTQLGVDTGEVRFDGTDRDEEDRGDLLVGLSFRGELGDAPLGWRKRVARRPPSPDPHELRARFLRPEARTAFLESSQRGTERFPRCPSLFEPSLQNAASEQRPRVLERRRHKLLLVERKVERLQGGVMITLCRAKKATAASPDRALPAAVESLCTPLECVEELGRAIEIADGRECFDCSRDELAVAR